LLGACASTPAVVSKPVEAVQQAVSTAATAVAAAVPVVTEAPVPPEAQRAFDAARAHLRAGRVAEAERGFRDVIAKHPELGGAHANLGLILRNAGKHDESIAALEQAVKANPKQPVFHNQLGVSYRHKGEFQKARDAYEQAIALDENYADAHLNLGVLLDLYQGDAPLALVHYERYLALSPSGDATVGKWVADLRARKPLSVAQAKKE
jgi:tetratricopeptide (TPR) repeat protein